MIRRRPSVAAPPVEASLNSMLGRRVRRDLPEVHRIDGAVADRQGVEAAGDRRAIRRELSPPATDRSNSRGWRSARRFDWRRSSRRNRDRP